MSKKIMHMPKLKNTLLLKCYHLSLQQSVEKQGMPVLHPWSCLEPGQITFSSAILIKSPYSSCPPRWLSEQSGQAPSTASKALRHSPSLGSLSKPGSLPPQDICTCYPHCWRASCSFVSSQFSIPSLVELSSAPLFRSGSLGLGQ